MIHRDIKPENILVDENLEPKLCDFGWTISIGKNESRQTFCGTYEYMAPEIFRSESYNSSVDVWSLGILLYELFHGYSPFSGSSVVNIYRNIMDQKLTLKKDIHPWIADLIKRILQNQSSKRPNIDQLLEDKCMSEPLPVFQSTNSIIVSHNPPSYSKNKQNNFEVFTQDPSSEYKATIPIPSEKKKDPEFLTEDSLTEKRNPSKSKNQQKMVIKFQFNKQSKDPKSTNGYNLNSDREFREDRKYTKMSTNVDKEPIIQMNQNWGLNVYDTDKTLDQKKGDKNSQSSFSQKFNLQSKILKLKKKEDKPNSDIESQNNEKSVVNSLTSTKDKKQFLSKKFDMIKLLGNKESTSTNNGEYVNGNMTSVEKQKSNKISLLSFSKKISLYMNIKQNPMNKGNVSCLLNDPQNAKKKTNFLQNNLTENSISQNEQSKNSINSYSIQHSKVNVQNYYSNKSNIIGAKLKAPIPTSLPKQSLDLNSIPKSEEVELIDQPIDSTERVNKGLGFKLDSERKIYEIKGKCLEGSTSLYSNNVDKCIPNGIYNYFENQTNEDEQHKEAINKKIKTLNTFKTLEVKPKFQFQPKKSLGIDSTRSGIKGVFKEPNFDNDFKMPKKSLNQIRK